MNTLFKTVTSSKLPSLKRTPDDDILNFKTEAVEYQSIHIRELELNMLIGVNPEEKNAPQRVVVNAEIQTKPSANWKADQINGVVSYADIVEMIKDKSAGEHVELVETFAHQIIDLCFKASNQILSVEITVDKPDVMTDVKSVGCTIKKSRSV